MANTEKTSPGGDDVIESTHNKAGGTALYAAERGQLATDKYGHSTVQIDPKVEARLRLKIDFLIVPTVSLLYLFCFIDRANIGRQPSTLFGAIVELRNIYLTIPQATPVSPA